MADDPKDKSKSDKDKPDAKSEAKEAPSSAGLSPAPTVVAGENKPGGEGAQKIQPDPLSDGTVPTVLAAGDAHRSVAKNKVSLTAVYRRADIMTTLFTFVGAVIAGVIILAGYAFFTRSKAQPTATPKVTKLDSSDLNKLTAFFNGNSAGNSSEVLTISSSSLFKNRVAVASDLKVTGGLAIDGTTALGDLTVDKTSTLGVVNTRGQLTVNGPLTVQSPALFNGGASFKGNLATTGNGSFGGSLSGAAGTFQDLSVNGSLNVNGHLNIGGLNPTAEPNGAAGSGASASVAGNDAAGTVNVSTGTVTPNANNGGELVKVTFRNAYPSVPTVVIAPDGRAPALLQPYIIKTANWFIIGVSFDALSHSSYSFDYWVVR